MGLTKAYTGTPQFDDISITLGRGQRIGLIGINGAGKSTLLKCLAGIDKADKGTVELASQANVIYVDQEPDWGNITVYNALFSGISAQAKATRYYCEVLAQVEMDGDDFSKATDQMEESNAWDYQSKGLSIAERLNINADKLNRDVSTLSGGERKRVGLVRVYTLNTLTQLYNYTYIQHCPNLLLYLWPVPCPCFYRLYCLRRRRY